MSQIFSDDNSVELISSKGTIKTYKNLDLLITPSLVTNQSNIVYGWRLFNSAGIIRFVKFYDTVSSPVVGVTIPKLTLPVSNDTNAPFSFPFGIPFNNGLWLAVTQNAPDTDTSAVPASNKIMVHIFYA